MNNIWKNFAASVPGRGHIIKDVPCQDASIAIAEPRPALLVCDGRGSAKFSHFGAQEAAKAFAEMCYNIEPLLSKTLDDADDCHWESMAQIFYRTLAKVQTRLAEEKGLGCREFEFTANLAIAGKKRIGFMQVGDGAIVIAGNGTTRTLFSSDKGEFANQTQFIQPGGESRAFHQTTLEMTAVDAIAITTDGPQFLMFDLKNMIPGPVFEKIFSDALNEDFSRQDILDFLTKKNWDNDGRGHDDRSLGIMVKVVKAEQELLVPETNCDEQYTTIIVKTTEQPETVQTPESEISPDELQKPESGITTDAVVVENAGEQSEVEKNPGPDLSPEQLHQQPAEAIPEVKPAVTESTVNEPVEPPKTDSAKVNFTWSGSSRNENNKIEDYCGKKTVATPEMFKIETKKSEPAFQQQNILKQDSVKKKIVPPQKKSSNNNLLCSNSQQAKKHKVDRCSLLDDIFNLNHEEGEPTRPSTKKNRRKNLEIVVTCVELLIIFIAVIMIYNSVNSGTTNSTVNSASGSNVEAQTTLPATGNSPITNSISSQDNHAEVNVEEQPDPTITFDRSVNNPDSEDAIKEPVVPARSVKRGNQDLTDQELTGRTGNKPNLKSINHGEKKI